VVAMLQPAMLSSRATIQIYNTLLTSELSHPAAGYADVPWVLLDGLVISAVQLLTENYEWRKAPSTPTKHPGDPRESNQALASKIQAHISQEMDLINIRRRDSPLSRISTLFSGPPSDSYQQVSPILPLDHPNRYNQSRPHHLHPSGPGGGTVDHSVQRESSSPLNASIFPSQSVDASSYLNPIMFRPNGDHVFPAADEYLAAKSVAAQDNTDGFNGAAVDKSQRDIDSLSEVCI
jgi:hypothetical protein